MKVGIMQPYFFPYLGYFSLIEYSDTFVFFDTPQYIHHGWINRNRILKSDGTDTYFVIPIKKAPRETPINQIVINENMKWREAILGQLTVYKRKAPHYDRVIELVKDVLNYDPSTKMLYEVCIDSLVKTCEYLNLNRDFYTYSKMNIEVDNVEAPDEWALKITKAIGGDIYVNPPGGKAFFDKTKYDEVGIDLKFLEQDLKPYIQKVGKFVPGLSIIDVLMFNNEKDTMNLIQSYHMQ